MHPANTCALLAFGWETLDHWSCHASSTRCNDFSTHCQARAHMAQSFYSHGRTTSDRDGNISITHNKSDLILNSSRWLRWIVRQWFRWLFDFTWYNMVFSGFRIQHGFSVNKTSLYRKAAESGYTHIPSPPALNSHLVLEKNNSTCWTIVQDKPSAPHNLFLNYARFSCWARW